MSRISNLLAPRRRCLESTSSGRSIRTSRRVRIWFGSDSFCMSSGTASFHSGMRRIKSAMARHSWVRITVSVVPVIARRCSRREFLKFIRFITNIKSIYKFGLSVCLFVCLFVCLSVCLYPINVKTAEPIGPKFFVGHLETPGKVYERNFL